MIFELNDDQYNKSIKLLHTIYKSKLIMMSEFYKIKEILEILSYGAINEANQLFGNSDDYIKHQINKILSMVK